MSHTTTPADGTAAGLEAAEETQTRNSPTVPADMVVATDPEGGSEVPRDSSVGLILSTGRVTVPDVLGMTQSEAADRLGADDTQLGTSVAEERTSEYAAGTVIRQSVEGGQDVTQGSTITITVAVAPPAPQPTTPEDDGSDEPTSEPTSEEPTEEPTTEPTTEPLPPR